jgi:hypothetical protein
MALLCTPAWLGRLPETEQCCRGPEVSATASRDPCNFKGGVSPVSVRDHAATVELATGGVYAPSSKTSRDNLELGARVEPVWPHDSDFQYFFKNLEVRCYWSAVEINKMNERMRSFDPRARFFESSPSSHRTALERSPEMCNFHVQLGSFVRFLSLGSDRI